MRNGKCNKDYYQIDIIMIMFASLYSIKRIMKLQLVINALHDRIDDYLRKRCRRKFTRPSDDWFSGSNRQQKQSGNPHT